MPRLSQAQTVILADWWTLVVAEAFIGTISSDVISLAQATAQKSGRSLAFAESSGIATLYGYARRMFNAAAAVQAAAAADTITPEHIGVPPWARDEVTMATAPIWHATYTFTYLDQAGNQVSDFRTSVFEMTMPGTIGDLAAAITEDAQALADKYGVTLVDAVLHQVLAV